VALTLFPGNYFVPYHWYRQDADGTWSHKNGEFPATNRDADDAIIEKLEDANLDEQSVPMEICRYFCTCSSAEQGEGLEFIY
jgi:hypothetical protein